MGNDGGSIPKGHELRREKKGERKVDPVSDYVGNVFNKDSVVRALLDKKMPRQYRHIRSLKDVFDVKFHANKAYDNQEIKVTGGGDNFVSPFDCPITGKPVNGHNAFSALKTCGHVFADVGLKETAANDGQNMCFTCGQAFTESDILPLNPPAEVAAELSEKLYNENRSKSKKRKAENGDKTAEKSENGAEKEKSVEPAMKKARVHSTGTNGQNVPLAVRVTLMKAEKRIDQKKSSEAYKKIFSSGSSTSSESSTANFTGIYRR